MLESLSLARNYSQLKCENASQYDDGQLRLDLHNTGA